MTEFLYNPAQRDKHYCGNWAQYLLDLHDAKAVLNFCGGMFFMLSLTERLRRHLMDVANSGNDSMQPIIFDAIRNRMAKTPAYVQNANADHIRQFHGREIRKVPHAAGGMGFVLQLSFATEDPDGWTAQEIAEYDGWSHDSSRTWRNSSQLHSEGFNTFRNQFGPEAYTLHHRFYLHFDNKNRMWLCAEDGCEGTPVPTM